MSNRTGPPTCGVEGCNRAAVNTFCHYHTGSFDRYILIAGHEVVRIDHQDTYIRMACEECDVTFDYERDLENEMAAHGWFVQHDCAA